MISIMKNFNLQKITAAICVCAIALSGCSKEKEVPIEQRAEEHGVSIDKKVDTEDVITMSMSMAKTLNPLINSDPSVDIVLSLMYEKLISIDETGKAVPNIAESWTFNDDKSVAYIKLKPNICFSDGTRLTAYDVAYSLRTIDKCEKSYYKNCLENIKTWSVTDDYNITVTFYKGSSRNIYYLALPVISKDFYGGDYAVEDDKPDTALGNGFYRFESYDKPETLIMIASLNCFKGSASVNKIDVIMTKDSQTDVNLFSQNITDILVAEKKELSGIKNKAEINKTDYTTNEYDFIGFNFDNPILKDRNVRQAIAYCINKESFIESIYLNNAEEAYSPISSSSWLYNSTAYGYNYDLSVAKMLLEQSGWRYRTGSDIVRQSSGENSQKISFRLLVNGENIERKQVALKLAESLKGIGIETVVEVVNFNTYLEKLQSGNYDIFVGTWSISPIQDFTFMFGSHELNGDDGNLINYNSQKMDEYLLACRNASNDEESKEAYFKLQAYISQELPYISLVFRKSKVYTDSRIEGTITPSAFDIFNGLENVTIKK